MKKIISLLVLVLLPSISVAGSMNMLGEKGNPSDVSKVIVVKMYDNYYEPKNFEVKKNQTIKFVVYNYGELVHEFNIATKKIMIPGEPVFWMLSIPVCHRSFINYPLQFVLMQKKPP